MSQFKLTPAQLPEKTIETQILNYLAFKRIWAFKINNVGVFDPVKKIYRKANSRFHIKGIPDILAVLPPNGRLLGIEVKSATGRPTPEQLAFIEQLNERGGLGFVARSFKEVEERLKQEGIVE